MVGMGEIAERWGWRVERWYWIAERWSGRDGAAELEVGGPAKCYIA